MRRILIKIGCCYCNKLTNHSERVPGRGWGLVVKQNLGNVRILRAFQGHPFFSSFSSSCIWRKGPTSSTLWLWGTRRTPRNFGCQCLSTRLASLSTMPHSIPGRGESFTFDSSSKTASIEPNVQVHLQRNCTKMPYWKIYSHILQAIGYRERSYLLSRCPCKSHVWCLGIWQRKDKLWDHDGG